MEKSAIEAKVREIVAEMLGIEPETITFESSLVDDLGANDLDLVEIVMAIEEDFGIMISDEDAEKLTHFGQIVDFLASRPDIR